MRSRIESSSSGAISRHLLRHDHVCGYSLVGMEMQGEREFGGHRLDSPFIRGYHMLKIFNLEIEFDMIRSCTGYLVQYLTEREK
jgi:hypothetical protein